MGHLSRPPFNVYWCIEQIQFEPPLPRDLDPKNLYRLREIFHKNHCRRLDVDNHIPAIVSRQDLANALRKVNIPQRSLLTNDPHQFPNLEFTVGQLRALHFVLAQLSHGVIQIVPQKTLRGAGRLQAAIRSGTVHKNAFGAGGVGLACLDSRCG